jgi:pectate lyase
MKKVIFPALAALLSLGNLVACNKDQDLTGHTPGNNNYTDNSTPKATTGFATQNGGTSGGEGGTVVTATSFAELKQYLESTTTAYIVKVNSRIYNGTKGGSIRVRDNKTLLGEGSNAFLDGIGLTVSGNKNVIVRNIKFSLVSITDRTDPKVYSPTGDEGRPQILVNGGDCISLENATNVWIDHCEFFSEDPAIQTNIDLYDGLVDIKANSAFITISWNYFHDHHKTHLIGSSDTDNFDRRITWHHNYYRNVRSRLPLYRYGTGHLVNNYFLNTNGGASSRMGACLRIESNVYENVRSPILAEGSTNPGKFDLGINSFSGITGTAAPATSSCTASIPYTFVPDAVGEVKNKVTSGAGVGKL